MPTFGYCLVANEDKTRRFEKLLFEHFRPFLNAYFYISRNQASCHLAQIYGGMGSDWIHHTVELI